MDTASYIEWRLFFFGEFEPDITTAMKRYARSGSCVIDVGANVGVHSLEVARHDSSVVVVACEPNPETFRRLEENLLLNPELLVQTFQTALSDQTGTVSLHVPDPSFPNRGMASLLPLGDWSPVEVASLTVDDMVEREGLTQVSVMKIDVEGWEAPVLRGAREMLRRDRPALIFEYERAYWERSGYLLEEMLETLADTGYRRFLRLGPSGPSPISDPAPASMNVLALADLEP